MPENLIKTRILDWKFFSGSLILFIYLFIHFFIYLYIYLFIYFCHLIYRGKNHFASKKQMDKLNFFKKKEYFSLVNKVYLPRTSYFHDCVVLDVLLITWKKADARLVALTRSS